MLVLALDTTTRAGSVAVLRDDEVLAVMAGDATRTHGERLPGELARTLATAGLTLDDIDLLAVARGPGAFTGLRIGLAAMQGLALSTGRPVIGVSALEALAVAAAAGVGAGTRVGAWMDAARGEVFAALYDVQPAGGDAPTVTLADGPSVAPPDAVWLDWVQAGPAPRLVCGDGALRYAAHVGAGVGVVPPPLLAPIIGRLGAIAAARGEPDRPHHLQPLYVRRPDVEPAS